MFTPPLLNKTTHAYQRLDKLMSCYNDDQFVFRLKNKSISLHFKHRVQKACATFSFEDLETIHPNVLRVFLARAQNKVTSLGDSWEFWKIDSASFVNIPEKKDFYANKIINVVHASDFDKKEGIALRVISKGFYIEEEKLTTFSFHKAVKGTGWVCLSREQAAKHYPNLLERIAIGEALGCSMDEIVEAWVTEKNGKVSIVKNDLPEII